MTRSLWILPVLLTALCPKTSAENNSAILYERLFTDKDQLVQWHGNSENFKINFSGVVDDLEEPQAKAYKLDISFSNSGGVYFLLPISIPAETDPVCSANFKIEKDSKGAVNFSFGYKIDLLPCFAGYVFKGTDAFSTAKPGRQTIQFRGALKECRESAVPHVAKKFFSIPGESLTPYLNGLSLFISGKKNSRLVLLIQHVKLEGRPFDEKEMKQKVSERWDPTKKMYEARFKEWRKKLAAIRQAAIQARPHETQAKKLLDTFIKKLDGLEEELNKASGDGYVQLGKEWDIDSKLSDWKKLDFSKADSCFKPSACPILSTALNPIHSRPVLPDESDFTLIAASGNKEISIHAARGEYEPASFAIHSQKDIDDFLPETTPLIHSNKKDIIPPECIDLKIVKCWYQAGTAGKSMEQMKNTRVLIPELLVNDDELVRVDHDKKANYLKSFKAGGNQYANISDPHEVSIGNPNYSLLSIEKFPVKDAARLLSAKIPKDSNKQYWLTVKVPDNAAPGRYAGKINLLSGGKLLAELPVRLEVYPFALPEPYYASSIYYRAVLSEKYPNGTISSEYKSEKQLLAELIDLRAHGVTNPTFYQPFENKDLVKKYLELRHQAGMKTGGLYYCYGININRDDTKESGENLSRQVGEVMDFFRPYGFKNVYFYGRDEATGKELTIQRLSWETVRRAGGKIFVAGKPNENSQRTSDIQDLLICSSYPLKTEAAKWHAKNHRIWNYGNPFGGVENPAIYRKNYGLLLWQNDYDGACTFAYQCSYQNLWNDFDGKYRDHNFTYPTTDGVIDTIAWEGYREAVDDVRYLTALTAAIQAAKTTNHPQKKQAVITAENFLAALKQCDLDRENLDSLRRQIADHIMQLN
ncbi:MAG: hypothetical protein PHV34_12960 [Verrucomicrobiae bacterium]|nr:hypothetical protein [Verrucomicrobiae bacterium]